MAAKLSIKGSAEYALKLSKLAGKSKPIAQKAIYKAAGIVADAIRKNIKSLPVRKEKEYGTRTNPVTGVTKKEKSGLLDGLGITKFGEDGGFYNVKVGFDGYNEDKTSKYPKGKANQMIARSVESGTTWLQKSPFVEPAVKKTKKKAIEIMQQTIDEESRKIMGE